MPVGRALETGGRTGESNTDQKVARMRARAERRREQLREQEQQEQQEQETSNIPEQSENIRVSSGAEENARNRAAVESRPDSRTPNRATAATDTPNSPISQSSQQFSFNSSDNQNSTGAAGGNPSAQVFPNPLSKFASYSCVFTLGVLKKSELADPDNTYRINGPDIVILRSGGSGDKQVSTAYEQELGITTEYFIEDVEIEAIMSSNQDTKQTNATTMRFQIHEPYSMGMLLETLAVSALATEDGRSNYLDAPYVLILEFKGYNDAGQVITVPYTKRFFPIKITNLSFNVTAGGSVYDIEAIAWNEQALADEVQVVNQDVDLKGSTVAEMLQIGEEGSESLTYILNNTQEDQEEADNKATGDSYVIMFPDQRPSNSESFRGSGEDTNGATDQSNQTDTIRAVSEGGVNLDDIKSRAEDTNNINEIGKARVDASEFSSGNSAFGRPEEEINEDGIVDRGNFKYDTNDRFITIRKGNRIQEIIEEIIILSEYGKQLVTATPDDKGMKKWFRIETEVYDISGEENEQQTGSSAKIYVYRVVPYLVHSSAFTPPSKKSEGVEILKEDVPKEYNYIYSGENDDIINFEINFNSAFFQALQLDLAQFSQEKQTNGALSLYPEDSLTPGAPQASERGDTSNEARARIQQTGGANTSSAISSGSVKETPEISIARSFNDAIVNGVDLISTEIEIWGDPYYLSDSGVGNYRAEREGNQTTSDKSIDYQYGEPFCILNLKTPVDINKDSGRMDFPAIDGEPVKKFSGIYKILTLTNNISSNMFTQTLSLIRIRNQQGEDTEENSLVKEDGKPIFEFLFDSPLSGGLGGVDDIFNTETGGGGLSVFDSVGDTISQVGDTISEVGNTVSNVTDSIGDAVTDATDSIGDAFTFNNNDNN